MIAVTEPWTIRRVALAAAAVLAIYGLVSLIAAVVDVLLLVFLAILLASILRYPLELFARVLPRPLAAFLTFALVVGLLATVVMLSVPLVREQGGRILAQAPAAIDRLEVWWQDVAATGPLADLSGVGAVAPRLRERVVREVSHLVGRLVPAAFGLLGAAGTLLAVLALAMFLAYQPRVYVNGVVRLLPRRHARDAVVVMRRIGDTIRAWAVGTLLSMTIVGGLTGIGLYLVGIDGWLVLALLAFLGEFVPYVGPVLTAVPGLAVGFAISPTTGLWVFVVYLAVQQLESHLLQPLIMRRAVELQPALLVVWQLVVISLFGLVGLIVATPVLASLQVAVQYLYVHRLLGKPER